MLDEKDGKYYQRQIRGNHIALVEQGRAGHHVCIKDSKPEKTRKEGRKKMNNTILARMFASFAKDEDTTPEEIAEAADEIQAMVEETDPDQAQKSVGTTNYIPENTQIVDEEPIDKADQIINLLQQLLEQTAKDAEPVAPEAPAAPVAPVDPAAPVEDADPDPMAPLNAFKKEMDEDPVGPAEAESNFVEPEAINETDEDDMPEIGPDAFEGDEDMPAMENVPEMTGDCKAKDAAIKMAIDAIRPIIASLPKNQRRAAADAAVKELRTRMGKDAKPKTNAYAAIINAKRSIGDAAASRDERALGRKITSERNCNAKKN